MLSNVPSADLQSKVDSQDISYHRMTALSFGTITTLIVWTIIYLQLDGLVKNIIGFNEEMQKMLSVSKREAITRGENHTIEQVVQFDEAKKPISSPRDEVIPSEIAPTEVDNGSLLKCVQEQSKQTKNLIKVAAIICISVSVLLNISTWDKFSDAQRVEKRTTRN